MPGSEHHEGFSESLYSSLRRIARSQLRRERTGLALQSGDLVHEAYVRLDRDGRLGTMSRAAVLALAATQMRRVLIDQARRAASVKHGGDSRTVQLDLTVLASSAPPVDILALDQALERLAQRRQRVCEVFVSRFFGGMTTAEIASRLQCSERTIKSDWAYAKAWVVDQLKLREPRSRM